MSHIPKIQSGISRGSSTGFTLIELMVTIAIGVIIMVVAVPQAIQYTKQRSPRFAAEQLALDLQRAKLLAIKSNVICSVTINSPAANQYIISVTNEVVDLGKYTGGVSFSDTPNVSDALITFTPQGICSNSGAIYLSGQNNRYRVRTSVAGGITVHSFSGGKWK